MHKNLLKLFRQLIKLASISTENGTLYFDGEAIAVGSEVFIEDENGELVPAPDGEYDEYVVADGKIVEIKVKEEEPKKEEVVEEEQASEEEIVDDEKESLKAKIAELEGIIAELQEKLKQIEDEKAQEEFNSLKPATKEIKDYNVSEKGAMKYFK